ncbi:TPA: hypothetical protein DCR49_08135, partial [Candidatus Delongbacteria bacterium]|nr:hypothetical protein [Candidatus Delongbacteria bacterium]
MPVFKNNKIKFQLTLSTIFLIIFFSGCSKESTCTITEKDGVKHYQNKNQPANPALKFVTDGKITIEGNIGDSLVSFTTSSDIEIDEDGNIYIFDYRLQKVFKYGKDGKFILSFSGIGNGPAEITGAQDIAIVGDSVTVCSPEAAKVSVYDRNGIFSRHITAIMPGLYYGAVDMGIGSDEILGYKPTFKIVEEKPFIGNDFIIKNKKYE